MAEAAEAAAFSAGIDTARYPIYDLQAAHGLIQAAQESLRERGLSSLPGFLRDDALRAMADDARRAAPRAIATDASHNAYQLQADARFPPTHVRNVRMRTRVASTAFDELPAGRGLARLYAPDCLTRFVGAVTGRSTHRLADPLGCCSVKVFHPGDFNAWHFDEAATSVTLVKVAWSRPRRALGAPPRGQRGARRRPRRSDRQRDDGLPCRSARAADGHARAAHRELCAWHAADHPRALLPAPRHRGRRVGRPAGRGALLRRGGRARQLG